MSLLEADGMGGKTVTPTGALQWLPTRATVPICPRKFTPHSGWVHPSETIAPSILTSVAGDTANSFTYAIRMIENTVDAEGYPARVHPSTERLGRHVVDLPAGLATNEYQ
jgi:hypothetical protein